MSVLSQKLEEVSYLKIIGIQALPDSQLQKEFRSVLRLHSICPEDRRRAYGHS